VGEAHIAKINELTVSEAVEMNSLMIDEITLGILNRPECQGIPTVSSKTKFRFTVTAASDLGQCNGYSI